MSYKRKQVLFSKTNTLVNSAVMMGGDDVPVKEITQRHNR